MRRRPASGGDRRQRLRRAVLRALGATGAVLDELLEYNRNRFTPTREWRQAGGQLADEPSALRWAGYADQAAVEGAEAVLRRVFIQLAFPIAEQIEALPAYQAAVRRGQWPEATAPGLDFVAAERLEIRLQETPAGRVPAIVAHRREDFERLVQALVRRNRPLPPAPSVGALMVSGYNNWACVAEHRRAWVSNQGEAGWADEFRRFAADRGNYQDRFILAWSGPYAGVAAADLGLEPADWAGRSLAIRIAHEACHYFTRRALGSMRNNLLDELLADYAGMLAGFGRFRAERFLRCMGIDRRGRLLPHARLPTYLDDPPLSAAAVDLLVGLLIRAAETLEAVDRERVEGGLAVTADELLQGLSRMTLEELACHRGADWLRQGGVGYA